MELTILNNHQSTFKDLMIYFRAKTETDPKK